MKLFLVTVVILAADLSAGSLLGSTSLARQNDRGPGGCGEAAAEFSRFKGVVTEWGETLEGDPYRSTKYDSAEGEEVWEGFNFYKSKSRFNKSVRRINGDAAGVIGRAPLLDEKGRRTGERVVKEVRAGGKVTSVHIWRITDRVILGIAAPSLKLALAFEKALITCPAEERRRRTRR